MKYQNTYDVGIYCRLSRDDNNGTSESMSIGNQKQLISAYVKDRGWNIKDIYIDDGYSGTNFDRPDFKRMISDIEERKIDLVITKDLSRLGRNYIMTGQYTDFFFPQNNVRYIAVNDGYDSHVGDNEIAPFKNILNEMYSKDISKKVKSARTTNAKQGKFMGSKAPYGYLKSPMEKHTLIVDENVRDIISTIFTLFADGDSGRHIANKLNEQKTPGPRSYYYEQIGQENPNPNESSTWGSNTVMQLIKNQVYIGNMVQNKRVATSFKSKKREFTSEEDWIINQNTHEPIIENNIWLKVQKRIASSKKARVCGNGEVSLFSGLIKCADCGAALSFTTKSFSGRTYYEYKCSRYANNGKNVCTIHSVSLQTLNDVVLQDIKNNANIAEADEEALISKLLKVNNSGNQQKLLCLKSKINDANKRLDAIDLLIQKAFEEKCLGNLPEGIFKKLIWDYEAEQKILKIELLQNSDAKIELESSTINANGWVDKLKSFIGIDKLNREILTSLIDNITVSEKYEVDGVKQQDIVINYKLGR